MAQSKFVLGQEVEVNFIGTVSEIYLGNDGQVYYAVTSQDAFARRVKECNISKLITPEDLEK